MTAKEEVSIVTTQKTTCVNDCFFRLKNYKQGTTCYVKRYKSDGNCIKIKNKSSHTDTT